jgi:beta-glucanase (GH16 family)
MPAGDWLFPSVKFLPKNNAYGLWPASGEIDLVEARGNRELMKNGVNIGADQISSSLHFGPYAKADAFVSFHRSASEKGKGFNSAFHRYQMEWSTDKITFSVDDIETSTIKAKSGFWEKGDFDSVLPGTNNPWAGSKMAPFDQEFYLSINLAVGGQDFFPDDAVNSLNPKPWSNYSINPMTEFWDAKNSWLPTWKITENRTKEASLLIDYIRVWAL